MDGYGPQSRTRLTLKRITPTIFEGLKVTQLIRSLLECNNTRNELHSLFIDLPLFGP